MELDKITDNNFIADIKHILTEARQKAYSAVNTAMVDAYWLIGQRIVEEEQNGESRAEYGKKVLENLSAALTSDFGKGYSLRNIRNFRLFYLKFPDLTSIRQTLSAELSWSHYQLIMSVIDNTALLYKQLFATKYLQCLHTEGELIAEIEREKIIIKQKLGYEIKL